jgi:hypothetical protein
MGCLSELSPRCPISLVHFLQKVEKMKKSKLNFRQLFMHGDIANAIEIDQS